MVKEMEHGQLSGWQLFSTQGPDSTIPQPFIEDATLIIDRMVTSGEIKKLKDIIELADYHFSQDTDPHHEKLANYSAAILYQLFLKYRTLGYISDEEEMYRRLFSYVDIATWAEIKAGQNDTKAVTVPGFRYLTTNHEDNINSHRGLFRTIIDQNPCSFVPSVSIKHAYPSMGLTEVDGHPCYVFNGEWCPTQGTFVLGLQFKVPSQTPQPLISLTGEKSSLDLFIEPTNFISFMYVSNGMMRSLFAEILPCAEGSLQIAFSYGKNKIYMKSTVSEHMQALDLLNFRLDIDSLIFKLPLAEESENGAIRSFWSYKECISSGSILTSILTS